MVVFIIKAQIKSKQQAVLISNIATPPSFEQQLNYSF